MLEELKEQYRLSLPDKISAIKLLLQDLREGKEGATEKLRLIAHTLHGSGTTFGYPEISIAAKQVEHADEDQLLKQLIHLIRVLVDASSSQAAAAKPSILIIDDDADITRLLAALLGQKCPDHQVLIASSAAEAEPLLAGMHALIVLDLVMPDCDGRIILRRLKEASHHNPSVFVLSGVDKASIRDECMALGAKKFIAKPFNPATIAEAIAAELLAPEPAPITATDANLRAPAAPPPPPATNRAKAANTILVAEDDELLAN
ncbi:MAG: response regulator, partial [Pseudomonadota bacterium]